MSLIYFLKQKKVIFQFSRNAAVWKYLVYFDYPNEIDNYTEINLTI